MILLDSELKDMLVQILEGQTKLTGEVKKNSIKLEALEKNVATIAEIQTAHKEQSTKAINDLSKLMNDKSALIENAVKNLAKDTKEVKDSIEVLKEMTGKHEVDINILKRRPV